LEALRLAAISRGELQDSFSYPDLARWQPPATQSDAIRLSDRGLVLVGLGDAEGIGPEYAGQDAIWQWLKLPFGQTVLGKRRKDLKIDTSLDAVPGERRLARSSDYKSDEQLFSRQPALIQSQLRKVPNKVISNFDTRNKPQSESLFEEEKNIDGWTNQVIKSDFNDSVLGNCFNKCIDSYGTVEGAVAFAAIVAKAKLARRRRYRP
jgi:hypothetical protein